LLARFGPFCFDLDTLELHKFGVKVPLEEKPARLLARLIERQGALVSREELHKCLWHDEVNIDFNHGLNKAANKLRTVLGDDANEPRYLETLSRRGYRFVCEVEVTEPAAILSGKTSLDDPPLYPPTEYQPQLAAERPSLLDLDLRPDGRLILFADSNQKLKNAMLASAVVVAALVIASIGILRWNRETRLGPVRAIITLPSDLHLMTWSEAGIAISPDGTQIVFDAAGPDGHTRLWLRRLDSLTPEALPETEGGAFPFWSPDGKSLGFFTGFELKRFDFATQSAKTLCVANSGRGGVWSEDGTILFARETQSEIYRINANGGDALPITHLDHSRYTTHRWPVLLPDKKHFVFLAANHHDGTLPGQLYLASLEGGEPAQLGEADSNAVPVDGSLLFLSHGKLIAQKVDLRNSRLDPHADVIAESVDYDPGSWYGTFAATTSTLIYRIRPEHREQHALTWLDAAGRKIGVAGQPGVFGGLSLSPDGKNIAAICGDPEFNICLIHTDGSVRNLAGHGLAGALAWAPDSSAFSYIVHEGPASSIFIKYLDARQPERLLMHSTQYSWIVSWHPDKRQVLVLRDAGNMRSELVILDLENGKMVPYMPPQAGLLEAAFSPDGRWVAYRKAFNGDENVFIASYPDPSEQYRVPSKRGVAPRWRGDGQELYFLGPEEAIYSVSVKELGNKLGLGAPRQLFRLPIYGVAADYVSYDVTRDGNRFLVSTVIGAERSELVLATNWRP